MDTKVLKQVIYGHGGSRIYFEDEAKSGSRELLVDTYPEDQIFAEYIKECVEKYYKGRA